MKTLYTINAEYQTLIDRLEQTVNKPDISQNEIDEINAALEINAVEFSDKAEAYAVVISGKRARADYLMNESKRLAALAKSEQAIADRLSEKILSAMVTYGYHRMDLKHYRLDTRISRSVVAQNSDIIPEEYFTTKTEKELNKTAIRQAIDAGISVPGAAIIEKQHLYIK